MTRTDRDQLATLRTEVAVLHNEVSNVRSEVLKVSSKIDNFAFVPTNRYEEDRKEDAAKYVTYSDYRNQVWLIRGLVGAIIAEFFVLISQGVIRH